MDEKPLSTQMISSFYRVDGKRFQKQYKHHLSGFSDWDQRGHAEDWLLFPENMGSYLSLDETAFTNGELYTILTNKEAHGGKGCLVAMVKGTQSDQVISILSKLPFKKRRAVKEVTLDMAGSMNLIVDKSFPKAMKTIDRFHVQRLMMDGLQDIRIKHRWEAIDAENEAIEHAKQKGEVHKTQLLSNGDTLKQLLARSRYLLYKSSNKWTERQQTRAKLLFSLYPDIETAYKLSQQLKSIFEHTATKELAFTRLAQWDRKVRETGFKAFNTICNTITTHYRGILNFFDNRSTNASAESFNAKIKAFRAQFRGVTKIDFFLFRLSKLYA